MMKLRIRHDGKTEVLVLEENDITVGHIKSKILGCLQEKLKLSPRSNFDVTLDGRTSLGSDNTYISSVGVVSGDLLKLVQTESNSPAINLEAEQKMSLTANEIVEETPSTSLGFPNPDTDQEGLEMQRVENQCESSALLLLSDYKEGQVLPTLIKKWFKTENVQNEFHAICIALHYLMMEIGFDLQTPSEGIEASLQSHIVYLEYSHASAEALLFTMTCTPLGQFVMVNGIVKPCTNTEEKVLSLQIKTTDFVPKFTHGTKPTDDTGVYKNLSRLSCVFKETIAYQALNIMQEELDLPPLHGILSLFPDLLKRIFSSLNAQSLCSVAQLTYPEIRIMYNCACVRTHAFLPAETIMASKTQTCTKLASVANDDDLWQVLYAKNFGPVPRAYGSRTVKEAYKQRYIEKKEIERQRIQHERDLLYYEPPNPAFTVPDPDFPSPHPGQMPGVIGGDYDLNPSFPYGPFGNPQGGRHPMRPIRPGMPGAGNPLPGSRFDPINPFGTGRFRPGRGGGMMDDDIGFPRRHGRPRGGGFGGGFM